MLAPVSFDRAVLTTPFQVWRNSVWNRVARAVEEPVEEALQLLRLLRERMSSRQETGQRGMPSVVSYASLS